MSINKSTLFVIKVSIIGSIGGILFGYDIGVISQALPLVQQAFHLTISQQELFSSLLVIGNIVGSLFGGTLCDYIGRKCTIYIICMIFIVGSLILCFSQTFIQLCFGRFIIGIGVSLSVIADVAYLNEISPESYRGCIVSTNELMITIGLLFAFLIDYFFISLINGWKYMFAIPILISILWSISLFFVPESPKWYLVQQQDDKAMTVYLQRADTIVQAEHEFNQDKVEVFHEHISNQTSLYQLLDTWKYPLYISIVLMIVQNLSGHAGILTYAHELFNSTGLGSQASAVTTILLGVIKVLFTIVSMSIVDYTGRKPLLLIGIIGIVISLGGLTYFSSIHNVSTLHSSSVFLNITTPNASYIDTNHNSNSGNSSNYMYQNIYEYMMNVIYPFTTTHNNLNDITDEASPIHRYLSIDTIYFTNETLHYNHTYDTISSSSSSSASIISSSIISSDNAHANNSTILDLYRIYICIFCVCLLVASYAIGYGPMVWLIVSELFPDAIRGRAMGIVTIANGLGNLMTVSTFLSMLKFWGPNLTFFTHFIICVSALIFVIFYVPETQHKHPIELSRDIEARMKGTLSGTSSYTAIQTTSTPLPIDLSETGNHTTINNPILSTTSTTIPSTTTTISTTTTKTVTPSYIKMNDESITTVTTLPIYHRLDDISNTASFKLINNDTFNTMDGTDKQLNDTGHMKVSLSTTDALIQSDTKDGCEYTNLYVNNIYKSQQQYTDDEYDVDYEERKVEEQKNSDDIVTKYGYNYKSVTNDDQVDDDVCNNRNKDIV